MVEVRSNSAELAGYFSVLTEEFRSCYGRGDSEGARVALTEMEEVAVGHEALEAAVVRLEAVFYGGGDALKSVTALQPMSIMSASAVDSVRMASGSLEAAHLTIVSEVLIAFQMLYGDPSNFPPEVNSALGGVLNNIGYSTMEGALYNALNILRLREETVFAGNVVVSILKESELYAGVAESVESAMKRGIVPESAARAGIGFALAPENLFMPIVAGRAVAGITSGTMARLAQYSGVTEEALIALSEAVHLVTESAVFTVAAKGVHTAKGEQVDWSAGSIAKESAASTAVFGMLRGGGYFGEQLASAISATNFSGLIAKLSVRNITAILSLSLTDVFQEASGMVALSDDPTFRAKIWRSAFLHLVMAAAGEVKEIGNIRETKGLSREARLILTQVLAWADAKGIVIRTKEDLVLAMAMAGDAGNAGPSRPVGSDTGASVERVEVVSAVTAKSPTGKYGFVRLMLNGTPIDSFEEPLGRDGIDHLKELLFSGLMQAYPELEHLPRERFGEFFTFNIDIRSWRGGAFGISLHIGGNSIGHYAKHFIRFHHDGYTAVQFIVEKAPDGAVPEMPIESRLSWSDLIRNSNIPENRLFAVMLRVIKRANFTHEISPERMRIMLTARFPELNVYFELDRLLDRARMNPEALTEHLQHQIAMAERRIREMLERHDITAREAEERIARLKGEEDRLSALLLEKIRKIGELEASRAALEASVDGLATLLDDMLFFRGIHYRVSELSGLGAIELEKGSKGKTVDAFRNGVASAVRTTLSSALRESIGLNKDSWNGDAVRFTINPEIEGSRTVGNLWSRRDYITITLTALIETPSRKEQISVPVELLLKDGKLDGQIAGDFSTAISVFVGRMMETAQELIDQERLSPTRSVLREMLLERAEELGEGNAAVGLQRSIAEFLQMSGTRR